MLFTAGLIIVLHTLVAHLHDAQAVGLLPNEKPKQEETLLDWVISLITTDMGEGHLEDFSLQTDFQSTLQVCILTTDHVPGVSPFLIENIDIPRFKLLSFSTPYSYSFSKSPLPKDVVPCPVGMRGPPVETPPSAV